MAIEWFTIQQIARHLKVSREVVYKLCQRRKIPASKVGGQWRFDVKEVDDWVRASRAQTELTFWKKRKRKSRLIKKRMRKVKDVAAYVEKNQ